VCRKLGVSKLSEIATEAELYNALVYVAQNQYAKMKDSSRFGVDDSDGNSSGFDTARSDMSDLMRNHTPRTDLYSPRDITGPIINNSNSGSWDESGRSEPGMPEVDGYSFAEPRESGLSGHSGSYPDFQNFLNCILSIRSTWGPYKRLDLFAQDFSIPESLISSALQYVCETCGCRHLDPNVPVERIANAMSLFYRSRFPAPNSPRVFDPMKRPLPPSSGPSVGHVAPGYGPDPSQQAGSNAALQFRPFVQQRDPTHNRNMQQMHHQGPYTPNQSRGSLQGYPPNVPNYRQQHAQVQQPPQQQSLYPQYDEHNSPMQGQAGYPPGYKSHAASNAALLTGKSKVQGVVSPNGLAVPSMRYQNPSPGRSDGLCSGVVTPPSGPCALSPSLSSSSLAQSPSSGISLKSNNLLAAYQQFWETVYQLFVSLFDLREMRSKTIDILADLSALVLSGSHTQPPPQMVVSLDVIANLACLELAKKMEPVVASQSSDLVESTIEAITRLVVIPCNMVEGVPSPLLIEDLTKELKAQVYYFTGAGSKLSDTSGPLKLSERLKSAVDDVLSSYAQPLLSPAGWTEVCEHVRYRVEAMVQVFQRDSNVHLFGGTVFGLHCQQDSVDFTALLPLTEMTEYKYLAKKRDLAKRIKVLENALCVQLQTDSALAHFRAAIAHIRNTVAQNMASVATIGGADGLSKARNASKLNADVELICKFGERYVNTLQNELDISRRQPQLRALLEQLNNLKAQYGQIVSSLEATKRKEIEGLKSALMQFGYADVAFVENSPCSGLKCSNDFGQPQYEEMAIGFTDLDAPPGPMRCEVVVCRPLFVHSSRLLASYFHMDESGKILTLAAVVKAFTAAHGINKELNTYAWNILLLHYLLNKKFLCCIQDCFLSSQQPTTPRIMCGDIDVSFFDNISLTQENVNNLEKISVFELLYGFFKYYVMEFNVFDSVASLRDKGEVLSKSAWGAQSARLWCLSIEVTSKPYFEDDADGVLFYRIR
jgi:hypothetical protein